MSKKAQFKDLLNTNTPPSLGGDQKNTLLEQYVPSTAETEKVIEKTQVSDGNNIDPESESIKNAESKNINKTIQETEYIMDNERNKKSIRDSENKAINESDNIAIHKDKVITEFDEQTIPVNKADVVPKIIQEAKQKTAQKLKNESELDDKVPGGYDSLEELMDRFKYLYNDFYNGSLDEDSTVEDDYTRKTFQFENSMIEELNKVIRKKKKGFGKRIVNTGLRIALDLYRIYEEQNPKKKR